jgi:hypothetical protein
VVLRSEAVPADSDDHKAPLGDIATPPSPLARALAKHPRSPMKPSRCSSRVWARKHPNSSVCPTRLPCSRLAAMVNLVRHRTPCAYLVVSPLVEDLHGGL